MTVLTTGLNLRNIANRGMSAVAAAEAREEEQRLAIEAQKAAAASQTMGTGAGIGGMVGANKLAGLKAAGGAPSIAAPNGLAITRTGVNAGTGGLPQMSTIAGAPEIGSAAQLQGLGAESAKALGVATEAPLMSNAAGVSESVTALSQAGGDALAATEALAGAGEVATTVTTVGEGAGTVAAVGTEVGAAASTGWMSSLATLAGPIAIGLGVSFLLSKLFD